MSGHGNESVLTRRSKPFASPLGGLPEGCVRIVSADDGKEPFALAGLPGLLTGADGGKALIVI